MIEGFLGAIGLFIPINRFELVEDGVDFIQVLAVFCSKVAAVGEGGDFRQHAFIKVFGRINIPCTKGTSEQAWHQHLVCTDADSVDGEALFGGEFSCF